MENELKELAVSLFEIDAVKFGDFVTKVGLKTPIYIDIRVIIAHPKLFARLSTTLWKSYADKEKTNQICGVPYTALPIASLISVESDIPMLIRRKEAKNYGTKKMIEGKFNAGNTCVIIEDVVTSGSSVLETAHDLKNVGLSVTGALVIIDREQGGRKNIENTGIKMTSLFTLTQLMKYLLETDKITPKVNKRVLEYINECPAPTQTLHKNEIEHTIERKKLDFTSRSKFAKNELSRKIFQLMDTKESTLCLAADLTNADEILEIADIAGPHIIILKIHVDIIENFNQQFISNLKELSSQHKFFIMEDRKFGDIGNTVALQYAKGIYKIAEWADLITVHSVAGPGILDGISDALKDISEDRGIFLVTQMSSQGALTAGEYIKSSLALSKKSNLVVGHVCQSNIFNDPGLIQLTPGVQLTEVSDNLGQQYNTPESVINAGADVAVVGRGITEASNKEEAVLMYKKQLWTAYKKRIS